MRRRRRRFNIDGVLVFSKPPALAPSTASDVHGGSTGMNMSMAAETTTNTAGAKMANRHPATKARRTLLATS